MAKKYYLNLIKNHKFTNYKLVIQLYQYLQYTKLEITKYFISYFNKTKALVTN